MLIVPNLDNKYAIFGVGNPVLDFLTTDIQFFDKYELEKDGVVPATEKQKPMFLELKNRQDTLLRAGGCVQNTLRGAQYMLPEESTFYTGAIANDDYGKLMSAKCKEAGVKTSYQISEGENTTLCAIVVHDLNRSMCFEKGASYSFDTKHLDKVWSFVEKAFIFYMEGYFVDNGLPTMLALGNHCSQTNKWLVLNLSAPFIFLDRKDDFDQLLPYTDVIICNELEAEAFSKANGLITNDLEDTARFIANQHKKNTTRKRICIITRGSDSTIVAQDDEFFSVEPPKMKPEQIVDTIGAGDAFAGGFLVGLYEGKNLKDCVHYGHWLAYYCLLCSGSAYPEPKVVYPVLPDQED